ncbi:CDP-diacylglycerol--glycerol-3-phosphate 3-phosphatidyltransferase [Collinsella sp. zg1085]|uniref:CDP-diacylglycerol--glycerol-3-phosphate 3-phosphatidyltransferase n=1 Tax=Collinsella sp. zg1085 TaxID=2844380 RepID=UPI001C0E83B6|nr:CDP-diacylglycerol--glycerol-3-phosphate 3-phosphatidyltransferase [Collinsella sp. zg1085]QWT16992.1 CDP-diacylglycerol--glycerol-3-phosphate 3-phosphatidyltransferase [Collinsella sp. zg1085]
MSQQRKVEKAGPTSIWTPANIVTCIRIVCIPIFMFVAELRTSIPADTSSEVGFAGVELAAFILFVLLSLTDKVDGTLARRRGEITDFGKFLDPIADKLLVFSALLILLQQGMVGIAGVFIILLREFLVSALRMLAGSQGRVIAADTLGKWKTAATMVSISCFLLWRALPPVAYADALWWVSNIIYAIAVLLTIVSGLQYFYNARDVVCKV